MHKIINFFIYFTPLALCLAVLFYRQSLSLPEITILASTVLFAVFMWHNKLTNKQQISPMKPNEQSALFVNIMENLTDPLIFLNHRKVIFMANNAAKEMFEGEIINQRISDFIYDTDALAAINKAIESGISDTVEYSTPNPRSRSYMLRIHVHDNSRSSKAEGRTILLTIYDISSIREAERMRVDFVANVSHELRTPLASILGFVETLQGPAKEDKQALERFLKIMQDEASRMTRLIEDLLSLSHIERDAHIPPSENISLIRIIENVIEALNISLAKKSMTTTFTTEFAAGNIIGDRDQLTQVFQNLIDNAIKYGEENSKISIHMDSYIDKVDDNKFIRITILNQGAGISEEHIERLTERFYRVDTARSRSLGGTGLGLAIVKHIVQRHEGRLSFESELGKNVTATVLLPRKS